MRLGANRRPAAPGPAHVLVPLHRHAPGGSLHACGVNCLQIGLFVRGAMGQRQHLGTAADSFEQALAVELGAGRLGGHRLAGSCQRLGGQGDGSGVRPVAVVGVNRRGVELAPQHGADQALLGCHVRRR